MEGKSGPTLTTGNPRAGGTPSSANVEHSPSPARISVQSAVPPRSVVSANRMHMRSPSVGYINTTPASGARFTATSRLMPGNPHLVGSGMSEGMAPADRVVGYPAGGGGYTIRRTPNEYASPDYGFRIRFPRHSDKSRGLRHFSSKVCEKVKQKGTTNYNEVAEELVAEYFESLPDPPSNQEKVQYDAKNIRRRVYDALNVLMAMNIIEKIKKEIKWVGLPTSSLAECRILEEEKLQRQERLRQKTEQLQELIIQLVAYKSLVQRNRERERQMGRPNDAAILYLPYIIVNTDKKAMIDCAISPDKTEYWFNFDRPFEIHDDIEVLKRLGLAYGLDRGNVPKEHVPHIKGCLPPALRDYVDQIIEGSLAGGVINQSGKGSQTVTISTNQQDRKPVLKFAQGSEGRMVSNVGPLGSYSGNAVSRNMMGPNVPVARYTVVPRVSSARYSGGAIHHQPVAYARTSLGGHANTQARQYVVPQQRVQQGVIQRGGNQPQRNVYVYQQMTGPHEVYEGEEWEVGEEVYEEEENMEYA
ncbi:transcription factor DP domain-containing protein [Ditylenchus destructor]|uniref:Transcription factor DP domain-containing protein n=1 Tax=Ditylenchus destructor TaxID=166010 RepID=A0AAD4NCN3_9BILA|nr:transcription factor DP domain-containing protein [Ditylenchus destructor]